MEGDGTVWLAIFLLFAVPIGLALSQYWAKSRASGETRLDGVNADTAPPLKPDDPSLRL